MMEVPRTRITPSTIVWNTSSEIKRSKRKNSNNNPIKN